MKQPPTQQEVSALSEAMSQLLDDMGKTGQSVCLLAKAEARVAFEPFRVEDNLDDWMTLADAKAIVDQADKLR